MENNNQTQNPAYMPSGDTRRPNSKTVYPFDTRDKLFTIIFAAFAVLFANSLIEGGFQLGYTVFACLGIAAMTVYCVSKERKASPFGFVWMAAAFIMTVSFAIFDDAFVKFCAFCLTIGFVALGLAELTDGFTYDKNSPISLFEVIKAYIVLPITRMAMTVRSAFSGRDDSKRKGFIGAIIGIACAFPVLLVVIPLLVSSDAAFAGLMEKLFDNFLTIILSVIFGVALFVYFFPTVFSYRKHDTDIPVNKKEYMGKLPVSGLVAFLGAIGLVYILYLFSQFAYFFDGMRGILPEGYTHADYARSGFFEMCAICFINLVVICLSSFLAKKKTNGALPGALKGILTFFGAFSALIVGTAFSKMYMYIDAFGLTRKRVITSVFMIVMLAVLIAVVIKLYIRKLPYFRILAVFVAVVGITVCFTDIDRVVAKYNTDAYLDGKIEYLDSDYMYSLSDSAIPYVIELAENTNYYDDVNIRAKDYLASVFASRYHTEDGEWVLDSERKWQSRNYVVRRADELLLEKIALIRPTLLQQYPYYFE